MSFWYVALAVVTLLSATPSLFFAGQSVTRAKDDLERRIGALYSAARSSALFVAAVVPLFGVFAGWLLAIAVAMTIVQALDALIGIQRRQVAMIAGPAALSALNLVAIILFVTLGA